MKLEPIMVKPEDLLLDPNNYRFHDLEGYKPVISRSRFADPMVQNRAMYLLQSTEKFELQALKDSILTNGYVPLERIVLEEYDDIENRKRYVVVEGNRRVAGIKSLLEDYSKAVVDIPEFRA